MDKHAKRTNLSRKGVDEAGAENPKAVPNLSKIVLGISQRCSALPDLDTREPDQILDYGENGLFD